MRVLDKVLNGGLKAGNLGLVMARHGTGKVAVLTCITIDHAMEGRNTLHISVGKSVSDIRAYDDEVLNEICSRLNLSDRGAIQTKVERHKQIYTFADGRFSVERLRATLDFLAEHAQFRPEMIEIQGWPNWRNIDPAEVQALKDAAQDFHCEIWLTAHTHRDDALDNRGVPEQVARFDEFFSVLLALDPAGDQVPINFIKVHDAPPPPGLNLEFDPSSMLIRWR